MANYVPRLKKVYKDEIAPALMKEFSYTTPMQIPAIKKIVVSMGVGEALTNKKLLDAAVADLTAITGQQRRVSLTSNCVRAMKWVQW